MNNIAIYGRKSIYSDKSDSVETQVEICREYISRMYSNTDYNIYIYNEDEGFSGKNTNRPGFQKMLNDITCGHINTVVCYKIDRISRNVADFSNTFSIMQKNNVDFISVKEQIDTSTPLGRAMMYICSVFAQMERETIAERVKDSSLALAKSGKWPGGKAPYGYKRERVEVGGKKHTIIAPDNDTKKDVLFLYNKFLEGYSLGQLQRYCRYNDIKSPTGTLYSETTIHQILIRPYYVAATPEIYDYFDLKGCKMASNREAFDGMHGVMIYGRTSEATGTHKGMSPEEWTVCVGLHEPIIDATTWLSVQKRFGVNKIDKTRKHKIGLLKGVLRCGKCGCLMRTKYKYDKEYNVDYSSYFCKTREKYGIGKCNMKFTDVSLLDDQVLNILKEIAVDKNSIYKYMKIESLDDSKHSKQDIKKSISSLETKINNLTGTLQESSGSAAAKYIIRDIERLDRELLNCKAELRELEFKETEKKDFEVSVDEAYVNVCDIVRRFDILSYDEKNELIKQLIKECYWDGETLRISFC